MFAPSICDSDMFGMCGARRTVVRAQEPGQPRAGEQVWIAIGEDTRKEGILRV